MFQQAKNKSAKCIFKSDLECKGLVQVPALSFTKLVWLCTKLLNFCESQHSACEMHNRIIWNWQVRWPICPPGPIPKNKTFCLLFMLFYHWDLNFPPHSVQKAATSQLLLTCDTDRMYCLLKIHKLKFYPQCDVTWREGLWDVTRSCAWSPHEWD